MKTRFHHPGLTQQRRRARRRTSGMAVIVVLALVAILLIYAAFNIRMLANLGREIRLLDQRQIRRLESQKTNSLARATDATAANTNIQPVKLPATP